MKMNLEELISDLNSKSNDAYFIYNLFKNEYTYSRRSFGDLFKYYKRFGISEKLLAEGLKKADFKGLICGNIRKLVFFKLYKNRTKDFLISNGSYLDLEDKNVCDKYTPSYIIKLLEE